MPPDLESLARARFDSPLTKAEIELVQRSPKGEFAVCGPNMDDQHPHNNPSNAGDWPEARHIRAALIPLALRRRRGEAVHWTHVDSRFTAQR